MEQRVCWPSSLGAWRERFLPPLVAASRCPAGRAALLSTVETLIVFVWELVQLGLGGRALPTFWPAPVALACPQTLHHSLQATITLLSFDL